MQFAIFLSITEIPLEATQLKATELGCNLGTLGKSGDLAVTSSRIHIMAFLGGNQWIEADPNIGRVITLSVLPKDNSWFDMPMNIVRWKILQSD